MAAATAAAFQKKRMTSYMWMTLQTMVDSHVEDRQQLCTQCERPREVA
jgi:hypothetical protein